MRLQDSICLALDVERVDDITLTTMEDSGSVLVELWSNNKVIGQYFLAQNTSISYYENFNPRQSITK